MTITVSLISNTNFDDLKEIISKHKLGDQENLTKPLLTKLNDLISSFDDSGKFQMTTPASMPTLTFLKYEEQADFIWGEELLSYRLEINHSAKYISFYIQPEKVEIDYQRIKTEEVDALISELEEVQALNFSLEKVVRDCAVRAGYSYQSPLSYSLQ
ncbi:hypothetical protein HZC30_05985 [Candidatus Woesearchaeota archaeon]|nr:hypothetical protein [Candidatus Woesearchaeota archaeon]